MTSTTPPGDPEVRTAPMVDEWLGCFGSGWNSLITPESYSHPAKFSRALIERIYQHALAEGWLVPGESTVLDPFGGVALGAHGAVRHRLRWIGIELEQPFTDLGAGCDCTGIPKTDWVRFCGRWARGRYYDGRYWCPACFAKVSQVTNERQTIQRTFTIHPRPGPPGLDTKTFAFRPLPFPDRQDQYGPPVRQLALGLFGTTSAAYERGSGRIPSSTPHHYEGNIERWARQGYPGATLRRGDSRQLQAVLEGQGDCCVSSPPYGGPREDGGKRGTIEASGMIDMRRAYGETPGQLGNLPPGSLDGVVSSPPYAASLGAGHRPEQDMQRAVGAGHTLDSMRNPGGQLRYRFEYGDSPAQLGNLPPGTPFDGVISSPPWQNQEAGKGTHKFKDPVAFATYMAAHSRYASPEAYIRDFERQELQRYSTDPAQLGNTQSETFWSAAQQVVSQLYAVLKSGGESVADGEGIDFCSCR